MPWSTRQRIIAIILLNLVYLVILLTVNRSDGDAAAVHGAVISKENLTPKLITKKISVVTTRESINNESISSHNDNEITSEKKPLRDDSGSKNINRDTIVTTNGTTKNVMGDSYSGNNDSKNDVKNDGKVRTSDGASPTINHSLERKISKNKHTSKRGATAPRRLLSIQLGTDTVTASTTSDTKTVSHEYQTTLEASPPNDQEAYNTSLSRDEANSGKAVIKSSLSRRYQEGTESFSPTYTARKDHEAIEEPIPRHKVSVPHEAIKTSPSKGNNEHAKGSFVDDNSSDQENTKSISSDDQKINEGYLTGDQEATENSLSGNQETAEAALLGDQRVNKASLPGGHEATAASLHEKHVITETSFIGGFAPVTDKVDTESPLSEGRGISTNETGQVNFSDSQKASQAMKQGGLDTTGTSIPKGPKTLTASRSDDQPDHINLDITVNMTGVTVAVNDQQVYRVLNITKVWKIGPVRLHAGIHLITLHQVTGQVMAANSYMTWQTGTDRQFLEDFQHIQDGRLLVILGAPDFTTFLEETTITWLMTELGALYIDSLAYKDVWCLVVHKGGRVVLEALTTSLPGRNMEKLEVSPLKVQATVPRREERRCGWYGRAGMEERAAFCETYEGYGNFCSCHDPPWSPLPHNILEYQVQEVIPVAIVTARRLPHVLRQVGQLWSSPGGTITPITIFVDGHNPEARALAALLNLPVVEHHNPAPLGWTSRISSHVKSVLSKVFEQYPEADKAIILEDDLELSVDFIPYFHQTATLLTSDPMLVCVNAYNYNAFNHTSLDPKRLYRFHGIPAYGWMVRREVAEEMVRKWAPLNETLDWDWWLRYNMMGERDILVPEIPRTKHRGGGGVHVTGLEQVYYYDQRPLNTHLNVTIDIKGAELTNYLDFHYDAIRNGQVLHLTNHPCKDLPIPMHPVNQSYVLYVNQPDESKSSLWPYYVAARCVGFNDHNFHENLQMMFTASFYGNQLYIITCPHSPFCLTEDPTDIFNVTKDDVRYAIHHPFRKMNTFMHVATRVPPLSLSDEVLLTNLVHTTVEVFMSEGSE